MTKEELNYRLPDKCCGKCHNSYNNTYGDNCCKWLPCIVLIDFGGYCDKFNIPKEQDRG